MDTATIRQLADSPNADPEVIRAHCLTLLPENLMETDNPELLWLYVEASLVGARNHTTLAPLAEHAWQLAAAQGNVVLAVQAYCGYVHCVRRTLKTLEQYQAYVDRLQELYKTWTQTVTLTPAQQNDIATRVLFLGRAGHNLVSDGVLSA